MAKVDLKAQAIKNLRDFKGILDDLSIPFWLDGGTLLGAYRDHDFCVKDEDDTDLCTWIDFKEKGEEAVKRAQALGFEIYHIWETEFAIRRNWAKIDLFFNMKTKDDAYTYLYMSSKRIPVVIPLHFYENLAPIEFHGMTFNRPAEIEEYLTLKYGNWKVPVHRHAFTCYSPEANRVVRPDWKP